MTEFPIREIWEQIIIAHEAYSAQMIADGYESHDIPNIETLKRLGLLPKDLPVSDLEWLPIISRAAIICGSKRQSK